MRDDNSSPKQNNRDTVKMQRQCADHLHCLPGWVAGGALRWSWLLPLRPSTAEVNYKQACDQQR